VVVPSQRVRYATLPERLPQFRFIVIFYSSAPFHFSILFIDSLTLYGTFLPKDTKIVANPLSPANQLVVNTSPLVTSLAIYVSVPCSEPPSVSVPCPSRLLFFPRRLVVGFAFRRLIRHQRFTLRIVAECRLDRC
jgi:hypothetical protein